MADQHRQQLKQAYQLLKQGQRERARSMVERVLKQDKSSADAWWLLANALDRDDLKIKSLKRVLSLKPGHARAQQMLDELQATDDDFDDFFDPQPTPTDSRSNPPDPYDKPKNDDFQLKKELPEVNDGSDTEMSNVVFFSSVGVILLVGGMILAAIAMPLLSGGSNTPEATVQSAIEAVRNLDVQRLQELTCKADRSEFDSDLSDFGMQGMTLDDALAEEDIELDLSDLGSEVVSVEDDRASVRLSGTVGISMDGFSMTFDMDELLAMSDVNMDDTLIPLVYEEGEWRICSQ
jgi:tetratricopeptide (TPR) repeat protein